MEKPQRRLTDFSGYYRPNGEPILFDEPLLLKEAAGIVFRDTLSPSGLKAEAKKGRLSIEKIANKLYVTIRAINEMRNLCHVENNLPVLFSSDRKQEIDTGTSDTNIGSTQQAVTRMMLSGLKENMLSS